MYADLQLTREWGKDKDKSCLAVFGTSCPNMPSKCPVEGCYWPRRAGVTLTGYNYLQDLVLMYRQTKRGQMRILYLERSRSFGFAAKKIIIHVQLRCIGYKGYIFYITMYIIIQVIKIYAIYISSMSLSLPLFLYFSTIF